MWQEVKIGSRRFDLLDLNHARVATEIIAEIDAGVEVYYDRRWRVSFSLATFLLAHPEVITARTLLVIGCGIGIEGLAAASYAQRVYLNDLSPLALELSSRQFRRNRLGNHRLLQGRYEELQLPPIDLAVGSFVVYNEDTLSAMQRFLVTHSQVPVLLANELMPPFAELLEAVDRPVRWLSGPEELPCVWLG